MKSRFPSLLLLIVLGLTAPVALGQQSAQLSGIIESQEPLAERTRVAVHLIDRDGVWGEEIATVTPVAGTFSITAAPVQSPVLMPLRSGGILLPGLQNEFRVSPEGVNFVQGRVNMYVDSNDSGMFERVTDAFYIGVSSLAQPVGFFSLIYVDRPATLTGAGVTLELATGWNIFTVRFPGDGSPLYAVQQSVEDLVLTAVLP